MTTSGFTESIHIQIIFDGQGNALIHGSYNEHTYAAGVSLKQALFAWHEPSFYGTELEVRYIEGLELVLLPAEMVIPFFAEAKLLRHIEWVWSEVAEQLLRAAPVLASCLQEKRYIPSFEAFRSGKLQWNWDEEALTPDERAVLEASEGQTDFIEGVRAAFSAAVFNRHYGTEAAASDLRREYPLLFARKKTDNAGLDEREWLVAIGWKADYAPFRPALQLLEPDEGQSAWRIRLILQDKRDASEIFGARMTAGGEVFGSWPSSWTAHVAHRSANWLERLRASLPDDRFNGARDDIFAEELDDEAAWRFLTADSQRLLEAGWQVLLPAWWETASRKKPRLRAKVSSDEGGRTGGSLFGLDSLIDFDWRIAIGEVDLTEAEFAELVARNVRLVRFRGQWIPLDPALLAQIRRAMASVDKEQGLSFQDVLQLHLLGNEGFVADNPGDAAENEEEQTERIRLEIELNEHLIKLIGQLSQQTEQPNVPVPAGLRAELRPYQQEGFSWLSFLRRFGLGACLADDMGLGKTVQLIAYLLHIQEGASPDSAGGKLPSLIICPTSVLGNWQKEISRFAPSLKVMLHYGSRRLSGEDFLEEARQADVVLTSYATCSLDQETLQSLTWTSISLDEAQNIKNAQTKQSTVVRSLPAKHRIALTGTPIENRLAELWSLYDFINPGYLGSSREFNARFAAAIEKDKDEQSTNDLQKLIKPFMLRRKKKDPAIQLDLPDKNEMKTYVHLTAEQGALYEQTVNELMEKMQKLEGIERKGAILAALTQLKQLCDHPILLTKEALPEAIWGETEKTEPPFDTETLIGRSSKLERLLAMVKELREEDERCLIFTQYIGMGQMLKLVLEQELAEPVLYLNGSTSKQARDRMIEQFQSTAQPPSPEQPNVFILSLKAGGVGLNLTAANHVFHFDRWWNPAVENQATDRAYRMGQTRDVQVHKFISLGTLEERIDEMLENKQQLSENVISSSEGWITELSTDELKDLFTLRRDMIG
ncbi:DEAD/DEAH box helicase [Cohnella cholangitidis]|uniref:DEAD/DEAH box helicase n=1 Tax=Cohnella cholangitidis TaxID=2598458 RepID=A0A7G5C0L4_9BACL|nr:DEAD/DEAH box helicase [Cohnella cholangitidis]QMV42748.1 DEAD/DEAH box helicase [Cohnella cholangitidis]